MHLTNRLILENYYLIDECPDAKFRLYINFSNAELIKKFTEINRDIKLTEKFVLAVEAIKNKIANTTQWNYEGNCEYGDIYAIKIKPNHRFYTIVVKEGGYRNLYMSRYARKQSNQNDKAIISIINSIKKAQFQIILP